LTKDDCLQYGGRWGRYHSHFDNIFNSLLYFVIMSQVVNWENIMYKIMNSNGPDRVPGYKQQPYLSIFFMAFIIFGAFFIINMFVGVVISAYNREIEKNGNNFLLTSD